MLIKQAGQEFEMANGGKSSISEPTGMRKRFAEEDYSSYHVFSYDEGVMGLSPGYSKPIFIDGKRSTLDELEKVKDQIGSFGLIPENTL